MKIIKHIYAAIAMAITLLITASLWYSTGDVLPGSVFAILMLIILVLGWADGARSAVMQAQTQQPVAFALTIGAITNTISTVFTLSDAEQKLAELNAPGESYWRIVPLFCKAPPADPPMQPLAHAVYVPDEWASEIIGADDHDLGYGLGYLRGFNDCRINVLAGNAMTQPLV